MGQPVWVFDIENSAMWWANQAAVQLWDANSLQDLLQRDFAWDMSDRSKLRLQKYLIRFELGERISEVWHFTPNGRKRDPLTITVSGITIGAVRSDEVPGETPTGADQRAYS